MRNVRYLWDLNVPVRMASLPIEDQSHLSDNRNDASQRCQHPAYRNRPGHVERDGVVASPGNAVALGRIFRAGWRC